MNDAIAHRGPDDAGVWVKGDVALGHQRLAIIDPAHGHQPMCNPDRSLWLTYNGEVYNFWNLRAELEKRGFRFRTRTDTEVVLYAYEEWGEKCVEKSRGMFALAIVDLKRRKVVLARDHFGIKPLYYRKEGDCTTFASEISALREIEDSPPVGNLDAVDYYLHYQYIPAPFTIYKDVFKLPPAHLMVIDFAGNSEGPVRYWELQDAPALELSDAEWDEKLGEVVSESVRSHMVADVPFGVLLSGGVDSTLVAQTVTDIAGEPVDAFSLGFPVSQYSELRFAKEAARTLQLEHTFDMLSEVVFESLPDLVRHCGEPFGDSSILPTWVLSQIAREKVPMVLSGDGGDEAFGGYSSYQEWMGTYFKGDISSSDSLLDRLRVWESIVGYYNDEERMRLWRPDFHACFASGCSTFQAAIRNSDSSDFLRIAQSMDYHTFLPNDILHKMDIASMYHGLEVRTPLADVKVAELAARLPLNQRIRCEHSGWVPKYALKRLLRGRFDNNFVNRPKQGFSIPRSQWLAPGSRGGDQARQVVNETRMFSSWFNQAEVTNIFDRESNERGHLWLLFVLGLWIDSHPEITFS